VDDFFNLYNCTAGKIWEHAWTIMHVMDTNGEPGVQMSEFYEHPNELPQALPTLIGWCQRELYDGWWRQLTDGSIERAIKQQVLV
jgi:hypothetical protein